MFPSTRSGAHIQIRRLVPTDAPVYRALMLEAYDRHPQAFTATRAERAAFPLSWWEARTRTEADASELVFGAWDGIALVGMTGVSFEARPNLRHKATLFGMYVVEPYQQLGLGQRLIDVALGAAAARPGVFIAQLTVTEGNDAALKLYARCGFTAFGTEPMAMRSGDAFLGKIHMWRRIDSAHRPD